MDHVYKGQLQAYALQHNLELPVYANEREGPPHAPRFRCNVTFCGQTFQSSEFFPTLKSAEHAAAKIAVASLTPQSPEGIDVAYKNLLQEIAQKESSLLPFYATATSGPSHAPTFTSTVEFAGKVFSGEEAKTKKLAEMSAAKVAFMSIKNGNSNQTGSPTLPSERQEDVNSNVKSSPQEIHSQPSSKVVMTPDTPSKGIKVNEDEFPDLHDAPASNAKEINVALNEPENPTNDGTLSALTTDGMKMNIASSSLPIPHNPTNVITLNAPAANGIKRNIAACSSWMPQNPTNDGSETSSCVVDESEKKKLIMGTGHLSIPTGQHVVCRPWNPEQRLNFHSKTPNPDGSKDPSPPEHPVEVIGRIRDYPDRKEKSPSILQVNTDNQTVRVRADVGYRDFTLDGVSFSEQEGLEEFYKKFIEERIKGVKVGNKCTIMMYGPTGAGKSHTMFGCGKEPGIVYRSLRDILGDSDQDGVTFVQVTVLEVYNEEIYDLLSTNSSNNLGIGWPKGASTKVRLEVMGKKAKNASFISGTEAGKISKEIVKVEKRRIVKSTLCNERSSRSHCIIILDVPTVGGRLMLVDMAGSENIDQAGQTGFEAKMQTAKINQGNIALKRVVESIANGDSHVPFRDSKLTMLLQDSFEDDKSKILMILCASPDPKEMHKTLCTLEYGAKAKCIVRGSHTPNKDKYGGDESASAVILGSRIAAMDEFIIKLQSEKKQKEKERNEAQKQLKKKEEEVAALRSLLTQREACATNEEEIKEKVNERTQLLKSELDKKLEECRRMAEEFVEMERRRMEERIVQQQEELEMMRRRLEEIEVEFRRSNGGSVDETSGFAKRLRSLYSDDDPGMVKSMDLDMGDPEPVKQVWGAVSHQSSNTISSNFTNLLQPKPSENMLTQMYPDRVCLSTVFEEEEVEEEEEKVIVEDKSICLITTPMPSLNSEGLGKENCFNGADDKESASSRRLRIQNIFTLCGNQRELSQHSGQEEDQANIASPDKKDNQFFSITNKAEALAVEEAKENNISVDQRENGQLDIYVKWETAADNPRKLITTLRVTKDATLADLRKLIEIYLGSDNQAFTFLKLGEPCGAQVAKEKESTVQATSLPLCNGHAYLATLRPGKSSQHKSLQPASPLPLNPIENMMEVTPISKVTPNHQVDEFSSPNLVAHLSSTPFITLRRH